MSAGTESPRRDNRASIFPAGTVTFLVADVDQSAGRGIEPAVGAWPQLQQVVDAVVAAHGGRLSRTVSAGNAIAGFESATDAVATAMALRAAVREGPELQALGRRLRMALHTGQARVRDDGCYIGAAVRTGERLVEIANGGQTLVSTATASAGPGPRAAGPSRGGLGGHGAR